MRARVRAEWDTLEDVVVHRPGIEMFCGLLEPYSFLYERAFSMDEAIYEHGELEHALAAAGVRVHRLKRLAIREANDKPRLLERARQYALRNVKFRGPRGAAESARKEFAANLDSLDPETVFNIMVLRPSLSLEERKGVRVVFPRVLLDVPLANLFFMRDQQAVTDLGVVVSRMSKPQRREEPGLTSAVLEMAGAKVAMRVLPPGTFEGGDFIPAGEFAMLGQGDRTNRSGVEQILARGLSFDEVAVVHQPSHPLIPGDERDPMINMHLDTYLNSAGRGVAVGCLPLLKRAKVEVFRRRPGGGYRKAPGSLTLDEFLEARGFTIVPITTLEQMCYASNFLCVRDHRVVAVEVERVAGKVLKNLESEAARDPRRYGRLLEEARGEASWLRESGQFFPHKKEFAELGVEAVPVQLQEITGGYGGAHCMTCAVSRRHRR